MKALVFWSFTMTVFGLAQFSSQGAPGLPQRPQVPATASISLSWLDPDPTVAGYNIYYGTESGVYTNVVDVGNTTNATIDGLSVGSTFYFAVTAYNSNEIESADSPQVFTVSLPYPPPNVLQVATANGAFIEWFNLEPGVSSFWKCDAHGAIEQADNPNGPWTQIADIGSFSPMTITRGRPQGPEEGGEN